MSYHIFDMINGTYLTEDYMLDNDPDEMWSDDPLKAVLFVSVEAAYSIVEDIEEDPLMRTRLSFIYVPDPMEVEDTERAPS